MQSLAPDPMLRYHPDTMAVVRRLYNLDKPGQMEQAVDSLEAWVLKQEHFMKKDFSREYLERVIIQLKGSVERAKSQLDKICTLRTMMPRFFDIRNPQVQLNELKGYVSQCLLPNLTSEQYRIFLMRINGAGPHTAKKCFIIYLSGIMMNEYIKSRDYCDGIIAVCDLRGVHVTEFIGIINITELRQIATIAMEGYDARVKSVHLISTSKTIDLLARILKQVLSTKIANRVHVHKSHEELYKFLPRASLPKDYGGDEKSLDELNEQCLNVFSSEENVKCLLDMRNARTDENQRSVCTFNETYLGLAGTFRTLNVD